ncbi:beta-glucoside-specific PTS transporter subunit IIABC [Lactiplantibacillus plantarum]|uniref:beta-glucoside-specific PTS transporter subunit IIABC n=1 Tax=Lactiplantibacillus plantarum TaxID=1590 RepID=UPI001D08EFCE|nr:beta-glucoside-specific PTS transporter subunit IIABC [Lactiplantibacillus plantarum]MCB7150389.1 beta-glucoside-specific PTS transporter subunit IIABC [Lactiplantibacillus plantarum]MCB7172341.1 beta-glucoside-specific PTS transporter subunit IIABC [Lactiplantibacillus plantarum]
MSSNKEVTDQIMTYVGGENNVNDLYHCATRLRFTLNDKSKFNIKELEKMPEVLGAVNSGDESQVIIGANVGVYFQEIVKNYHIANDGKSEKQASSSDKKDKNIFKRAINVLVGIMAPIIPVLIAGGMFKVVLALCSLFGMNQKGTNYQILSFIADAAFYFLPFIIANSAAKKFNTSPYLAMLMAGVILHPNFAAMVTAGKPIALFGMPIRLVSYGSTVIPIILIVWFMSYVDKFAEKVSPNMIKTMLKPLLILLITAPVALIIIGPLGSLLGDGLFAVINFLDAHMPWLVPTLMGTFCPLLVMIGMHVSLTPLAALELSKYGSETVFGPGMLSSNLSQAGASLAIAFKEKNAKAKQIALSAGVTALSGITEPALYGVTLKYKRVLACVMASGGIAGLYSGLTGVVRYSFGSPGIFTLPVFIGKNPNNIINALITAGIAVVVSFISTYFFAVIDNKKEVNDTTKAKSTIEVHSLKGVVDGQLVPLENVNDQVFASGSLGSGVAIYPSNGMIVSPIDGIISMVYPTGHAVGITTDDGQEILIHIGINTVNLKGRGFKVNVKQDQKVKAGDPLVQVDLDLVKKEGFDPTVMVLALNTPKENIKVNKTKNITIDDNLLNISSLG